MSSSVPVLQDFLELGAFASEVKRHKRTVRRWLEQLDGPPYTMMGKTIYLHVPSAREWMLNRMKNMKKRPRKRATRRT